MRLLRFPAVLAAVIVALCTSLVIQSSSPAAAFDVGPLAKATLSKGVEVGKGASLFGRFSNPVGWAITAGTVAWWGYSNRDSIMDFIAGTDTPDTMVEWAESDPNYDPEVPSTPEGWSEYGRDLSTSVQVISVSGRSITFEVTCRDIRPGGLCGYGGGGVRYSGSWSSLADVATAVRSRDGAYCKNTTSGAVTKRDPGWEQFVDYDEPDPTRSITKTMCSTGEVLDGLIIAPRTGWGILQQYGIAWGSVIEDPLPSGSVDFAEAEVTARCKNTRTGETRTIESSSELGDSGTVVLPSCKQHFGDDWYGTGITVAPTKPEIDNEPIPDEIEVPDFLPLDWDELIPDEEDADWQPCYGTKKGCSLSVWIDNDPCDSATPICKTWTKIAEKNPERVDCMFGIKVVPIRNCYPLAGYYQPGTQTNTGTETTTPTTGDTDVETGTGTETTVDTKPVDPVDPADQPAKDDCFPKGWGKLNPVEWVYKPVTCALKWAFVPKTSFAVRMDRMSQLLSGRAPFSWFQTLNTLPSSIPGAGCPDWRVKVGSVDQNIICGTGMGNAMRGARPVFTVLMIGAMFYPMIRSVLYAAFPLVKPTPVSTL